MTSHIAGVRLVLVGGIVTLGIVGASITIWQLSAAKPISGMGITSDCSPLPAHFFECRPSFDGFVPCDTTCSSLPGGSGEQCGIEIWTEANEITIGDVDVTGWWIVRSRLDGQQYYIYVGTFAVTPLYTNFSFVLCPANCWYGIEGFAWHRLIAAPTSVPGYFPVRARVVIDDCMDCREPTPTPFSVANVEVTDCLFPVYIPSAKKGQW
jgi:hypothetical protein